MFSTMKRYAIGAGAFIAGAVALLASTCSAAAIINLPTNAIADLTANASEIMTDVWVLVALAIGIPMGFYIIRKVIALIPKH
jgi:thiol:disulfide interchange protein